MTNTIGIKHFQSLRVISALMIREMTTRYGRSWGGYLWAVLEPVGMIAVLSIAFSQFLRTPPIGQSFPLFYATGFVPFHFFNEIAQQSGNAVSANRTLMQFPVVTALDTVFARFFLSLLTLIVVSTMVFTGILFLTDEPVRIQLPYLILSLATASIVGLGIGTMNAVLFPFFPVWRSIWSIISRPLFLISGIFFTFDSMPKDIQTILWWNPLVHVIGIMRKAFYPTYEGAYISLPYALGIGIGLFVIGAALLVRHRSAILESL